MNEFLTKAQAHLKEFSNLPSPNHPLWKGFPLRQWEARLSKKNWNSLESSSEDSLRIRPMNFPFSTKAFSILEVSGGGEGLSVSAPIEGLKLSKGSGEIKNFLNSESSDSYNDLHQVLSRKGLKVEVSDQIKISKPIVICSIEQNEGRWNSVCHSIKVGKNSSLKLILTQQSPQSLLSEIIQVEIEEGGSLKVVDLGALSSRQESYSRIEVKQHASSLFELCQLAHTTEIGRSEVHVDLMGRDSEARVSGVHLLGDTEIFDSRVRIVHVGPETKSHQNFRCVVSDRAQSLFGGSIVIQKDAQGVASSQSHKALLVSKGARATAFPELEIHADDVKAAHGSSTGQLDLEQVFYLKSRGLSLADATHLLSEAFVNDVILKTSDQDLRQALKEVIGQILPKFVQMMESKWLLN